VKLSLTRIAQRPSREGKVAAGDGETLPPGDGLVAPAGLGAGGAVGAGVEAAWQATAAVSASAPSTPRRATAGRISQGYTANRRRGFLA